MITRLMLAVLMCATLAACGGAAQFNGSNPNDQGAAPTGQDQPTGGGANGGTDSGKSGDGDHEDDDEDEQGSNLNSSTASSLAMSSASSSAALSSAQTSSAQTNSSLPSSSAVSSSAVSSSSSAPLVTGLSCQTPPGRSHNAGQNCLSCHKKGGSGSSYAVFTLAGTAYTSAGKAQANAIIKIYDHNSNTVALCIKTNNLGNFYTTQAIAGLANPGKDAVAESPAGAIHTMSSTVTSGACNACHGVTVAKITAD